MVDTAIVLGTVKNMLDSGLSDDIIKETLKDIGLNDAEIASVLRQARGEKEPQPLEQKKPSPKVQVQESEEKPQAKAKPSEQEQAVEKPRPMVFQEKDVHDNASIQNAILDLSSKVESLQARVEKVSENSGQAVSGGNQVIDSSIGQKLDSLSTDVKELKAGTNALVDLMKKILETDRQVLVNLERKK